MIKSVKKEIKCQFCGNICNEVDLLIRIQTTDIFLGLDWGIPSWKEYRIGMCPNCRAPLMRDNKIIKYTTAKKISSYHLDKLFEDKGF